MSIASNLQRIMDAKSAIRESIVRVGVDLPESEKIDTYYQYIDQIGSKPNPSGDGTLADLKLALSADNPAEYYPVGTELEDTYDGQSNPLIVAQYLDSKNNEKYDGAEGVILIRKYVEPTSQEWSTTSYYKNSTINSFLMTTYYNNCSDNLRELISEINVPCYTGYDTYTPVPVKLFLMSAYEVCSTSMNTVSGSNLGLEGIMWEYWRQQTGLNSPSISGNNGRIMRGRDGVAYDIWLRTASTTTGTKQYVNKYGDVGTRSGSTKYGVLPACFIAKD